MRVLLAESQPNVRRALRFFLKEQPGLTLVGDAAATPPLLQQVKDAGPDVILLDWELPDFTPTVLLTSLRQTNPRLWVIGLSSRPDLRSAALAAGADAFVCKSDPPQALLAALGTAKSAGNNLPNLSGDY